MFKLTKYDTSDAVYAVNKINDIIERICEVNNALIEDLEDVEYSYNDTMSDALDGDDPLDVRDDFRQISDMEADVKKWHNQLNKYIDKLVQLRAELSKSIRE